MQMVLQERLLACFAEAQPCILQTDLLAGGILTDQQIPNQVAGNLQGLEEVAQGTVYPCLPLMCLPSTGLPLACLLGVTVEETSEGTCGGTAGLEGSVVEPLLKEVVSGKAAEQQSLLEEEGSAVLGHGCLSS